MNRLMVVDDARICFLQTKLSRHDDALSTSSPVNLGRTTARASDNVVGDLIPWVVSIGETTISASTFQKRNTDPWGRSPNAGSACIPPFPKDDLMVCGVVSKIRCAIPIVSFFEPFAIFFSQPFFLLTPESPPPSEFTDGSDSQSRSPSHRPTCVYNSSHAASRALR